MLLITFSKVGHEDIVLTEDDIFDWDFEASCFSSDTFELGGVNAKSLYLLIDNNDRRFSRGAFSNSRAKLEINGHAYGEFNVELPKRRNGVIEFTAYDDMVKLDCEYPSDYVFPQLFWSVYAQCLFEAGLTDALSFDNFVLNALFNNGVISHEYTDYIYANSCRQLISGMAEWNGGFVHFNSENKLQVDVFSKEVTKELYSSQLLEFDYSDETITFSKVKTSFKNKTYEKGDDSGYTLVINNQYISYGLTDENFETYLTFIYDYYNGFTLTPMSFTLAEPDHELKIGDRIAVYDEEEDVMVIGNISKINITGNCTMTITCGGFGNVSSTSNFSPTSRSLTEQAKTESVHESAERVSLGTLESYTYLSDSSIEYNGLTYTVEKDSAGLISKISDSDGAEFEPESGGEITDVGFHNAVLTAVALLCGLPKPAPDDTLTAMVQYRYNLDSYTVDGTTINWLNQAGGEATMFTLVGATIVDGGVNLKGSSTSKGTMAYTGSATAYTIYLVVNANGGHRVLETHGNSSYSTAVCLWGDTGVYRATAYLNGSEIKSAISSSTRAVIAVATQADGTYSMYINGELVGTNSGGVDLTAGNICLTHSNQWGNSSGDFYYYDFALAETAHDEENIITNSKYLMSKYGIK